MGEKPGKVQALVVELSAHCVAIRAKSGEGDYSEAVDSLSKGAYTHVLIQNWLIENGYFVVKLESK